MNIVIGIIVGIFGGIALFFKSKASNAESLNSNAKTMDEINVSARQIAESSGLVSAEEKKREAIQKTTDSESNKEVTNEDLSKFFNDRNGNK